MSIAVELLDGKEYSFERESALTDDGNDEMRARIILVEDLLSGSQFKNIKDNINNRERIIARNEMLANTCASNLLREDIESEKTDQWYSRLHDANRNIESAEKDLLSFQGKSSELDRALKKEPMILARWVLGKQHGLSESEADCLLNYDVACSVCAAILGFKLQIEGAEDKAKKVKREEEKESPLSEKPSKNESG